jgi:hypothetical protein
VTFLEKILVSISHGISIVAGPMTNEVEDTRGKRIIQEYRRKGAAFRERCRISSASALFPILGQAPGKGAQ